MKWRKQKQKSADWAELQACVGTVADCWIREVTFDQVSKLKNMCEAMHFFKWKHTSKTTNNSTLNGNA